MVSEFEFIRNLKSKYALGKIGDDCAVLPKDNETDLLLTADMLVEDIDFRLEWTTPELVGAKALAVSLSDIAAMGGEPTWAMLSIAIPEVVWDSDFVKKFYEGWFTVARHHHVELVGGDVSRTSDKIVIDSIVGGQVAKGKAILRSGAELGDLIFVTGCFGGAAGGLTLLESGFRYADVNPQRRKLIIRQLRPTPQLHISKLLQLNDLATAMIDVSDGLMADLGHICSASGVGAKIVSENIPRDPNLSEISGGVGDGEDFELLFTVNPEKISGLESLAVTCIGEITATKDIIEVTADGQVVGIAPGGYRHF